MATANVFPQQFGRYYLTQKIAMGGMAEVFRAKSIGAEGFEKVVVIKRILPHFSEDEGFVTMFKDEARIAAHLAHANVVQVFDFDEVDGLFYIAMEYVEGCDLKHVLDVGAKVGKPLSIAQAVHVMIEASQGLHYAHSRVVDGQPLNIIHRDVSPHNMMVSYGGEVKIMDFGIAKAASRSTKTRVGTVKGKCAYMSPEQARGKPLDGRSDLFALGVCLWEMLTGKRLFVGESDFETLNNVLKAEVPKPSELNPEVPKELDAIVLKALARDRDERQADVGGFVSELRRWFYSAVPDPEAIKLNGYMQELFATQIERLREDSANESQQMTDFRKGGSTSAQRKMPGSGHTGSQPTARPPADDERTMALDSSGLQGPGDSDRTMALPDAMNQLGLAGKSGHSGQVRARTGTTGLHEEAPAKSKAGLFVGLGVVAAAVIGVGGFVATRGAPAPAVVAGPAAPAPVVTYKLTIKCPGAKEIKVNDKLVSTEAETVFTGEKDSTLTIVAQDGDRKKLVHYDLKEDGQTVTLELPKIEEKKPAEAAVGAATTVVIVQVEPQAANVTVNGQHVELKSGQAKLPNNAKLGESFKVEAKADGYKPETKEFLVKNDKIETFAVTLQKEKAEVKDKPHDAVAVAAPSGPGKLVLTAKPWAKVSEKGKDLGLTPVKIDLPAGKHTYTLTKGEVTKTVSVTIKPGQTASQNVDMTAP